MKNLEGKYTVEQMAAARWYLRFNEKNQLGESLLIELCLCEDDPNWKNSNPKAWFKNGYTDRLLETYWHVDTEIKDSEGCSWRKYDIQSKRSEDGERNVINFDWMMEATEENKNILINEIYKLFINATGKSATEKKIDKIYDFAKMNGLEVVTELPEGYKITEYATDPCGCVSISNILPEGMNRIQAIREGLYIRKLLLV